MNTEATDSQPGGEVRANTTAKSELATPAHIENKELRAKLEKLEVPKMVVWVDSELKVETTNLTEKTVDEIIAIFVDQLSQLEGKAEQYNEYDPDTQSDDPVQAVPLEEISKLKGRYEK